MKKYILATIFFGFLLVLAACGGNDTDKSGSEDTGSQKDSSPDSQLDISASNFEFDQAEYTVNAGEEVNVALSSDEGMHGLAIDDFDVNIEDGEEATFTPDEPGEYTIYCSIPCGQGHDDMQSTLIVQ